MEPRICFTWRAFKSFEFSSIATVFNLYICIFIMFRRQARLRREYLYRKSLQGKHYQEYAHRLQVRAALAAGKPIPTELRGQDIALRNTEQYVDGLHDAPSTHHDDEYASAAEREPKVVITTSRDPSSRLRVFAKEFKLLLPTCQRLNRGNMVVTDLVEACKANQVSDIVILHEHRGEPDGIIISHLPFGPTAYFNLKNVVMRHDVHDQQLGTVSEAIPHLIFHNFDSPLAKRLQNILQYLFPTPKQDSKRTLTFFNQNDVISFRHHVYERRGKSKDDIALQEVGPRFEMQLYQIKLGTLDQIEAEDEWVLRPYMNTAKKRRALG